MASNAGVFKQQKAKHMETISISPKELGQIIAGALDEFITLLRFNNRKAYDRVTRDEAIQVLGTRHRFDKAVEGGHLKVQKDNNRGQFSEVYCYNRDFKIFLKNHYPELHTKYYSIKI